MPAPIPVTQNVIQSFESREDLLKPAKKPSKGLEKAIVAAKAELGNMAEVTRSPVAIGTLLGPTFSQSSCVPCLRGTLFVVGCEHYGGQSQK